MTKSLLKKSESCEETLQLLEDADKVSLLDAKSIAGTVLLVGMALIINLFSVGFGFSLSVLYPEFTRVFDADRSITALVQSMYSSFLMGGAVFWNYFMVKYGPGLCIICGAFICTVGVFLSFFAVNIWMVLTFTSIIAGIGGSIAAVGPFVLINDIMGKWKHAALAVIPIGSSLGQFVFVYLIEFLIEEYNWNGALLIMSGIIANMIPCGMIIYYIEKTNCRGQSDRPNSKLLDTVVFKEWRLYLLLINSLLLAFSGFVEAKFLVDFMILKGFERSTGSMFVSYIGLTNFVGRIIGCVLKIVYKGGNSLLQLSFLTLLIGSSHAVILLNSTYYGILSGALLNGLSFGLCIPHLPVIMLEIFNADLYGPAFAVCNISGGIGNFFGGYFGGFIEDMTDNYDILFQLAVALSVTMSGFYLVTGISVSKYYRRGRLYTDIK